MFWCLVVIGLSIAFFNAAVIGCHYFDFLFVRKLLLCWVYLLGSLFPQKRRGIKRGLQCYLITVLGVALRSGTGLWGVESPESPSGEACSQALHGEVCRAFFWRFSFLFNSRMWCCWIVVTFAAVSTVPARYPAVQYVVTLWCSASGYSSHNKPFPFHSYYRQGFSR